MMVLPESVPENSSAPTVIVLPESATGAAPATLPSPGPETIILRKTGTPSGALAAMPSAASETIVLPNSGPSEAETVILPSSGTAGPDTVLIGGPGNGSPGYTVSEGATLSGTNCCAGECADSACGFSSRLWASGEYLFWWIKDFPLPAPLVTTGSPNPATGGGVLGRSSTTILFGGSAIEVPVFSGARIAAGYWLDEEHIFGIEGSGFFLAERSAANFRASSDLNGTPDLTSPVIDTLTQSESGSLIAFPGAFAGSVAVTTSSELWGAEANVAGNMVHDDRWTLDLLTGFRYLELREDLTISRERTVLPAGEDRFLGNPVFAGNSLNLVDDFSTRNNFYGWQVGGRAEFHYNRLALTALGKLALGGMHQVVDINGTTTLTPPTGMATAAPGGLLALPSNAGHHTQEKFTVLPEFGVTAGWQVNDSLRAFVGYSVLYADQVVRPGEQINRNVNPTQLPTSKFFAAKPADPAQPAFNFNTTNFWAQGIGIGVAFTY
jgi:hypothetical protein